MSNCLRPGAALAALALLAGCHGGGDGPVPTVALKGTVTLDGNPLPAGFVVFYPDVEGAAPVSATVAEGRFEMPAIPPGQYKVAVRSKILELPATSGPVTSDSAAPSANPPADPIPLKYREPSIPVEVSKADDAVKIELTRK